MSADSITVEDIEEFLDQDLPGLWYLCFQKVPGVFQKLFYWLSFGPQYVFSYLFHHRALLKSLLVIQDVLRRIGKDIGSCYLRELLHILEREFDSSDL